jgi:hypothetical protein
MNIEQGRVARKTACVLTLATALNALSWAAAQDAPADAVDAIRQGTLILDLRARFEQAEQTGKPNDAEATTLRTRLSWQTAKWNGLQALVEFEDVRQLGPESYDTNLNGKTTFAQVFDPETTELNRFQLVWAATPSFSATLGRQRINLDDQRFIGGSAWRQDEQTFDAARFDAKVDKLEATYVYIEHVNRIFAEDQDWESDSHILTVAYPFADALKLSVFSYALDFDQTTTPGVRNHSSLTWGGKASGKSQFGETKLDYSATLAIQKDYGSSLLDYELGFLGAEIAATHGPLVAKFAYDELEGNGTRGFSTPLGSLHAFNGWSDAFIVNGAKTTVDGLRDANAMLTWNTGAKWEGLSNLALTARYHEFEAERTGADLGSEWNLMATGVLAAQLSWILKYADYDGPGIAPAPADRTKLWFGLEWKL